MNKRGVDGKMVGNGKSKSSTTLSSRLSSRVFLLLVGLMVMSVGTYPLLMVGSTLMTSTVFSENSSTVDVFQSTRNALKQEGDSTLTSGAHNVTNQIIIQNDADFSFLAGMYGWQGNGSASNPYIIENIEIVGRSNYSDFTGLITINNTRSFFIIRNCILRDFQAYYASGIYLENVSNGEIYNCEIYNINGMYGAGIRIMNSTFIDVYDVYAHDNYEAGVDIQSYSQFIDVYNSTFTQNGIGVQVGGFSHAVSVFSNDIYSNNLTTSAVNFGIGAYSVTQIWIENNKIWDHRGAGIFFDNVNVSTIISNDLHSNSLDLIQGAIHVQYSQDTTIQDNYIHQNWYYGVSLSSAADVVLIGNTIHSSGNSGIFIGTGVNYATNPPSQWINITGNVISASSGYGLEVFDAMNVFVYNNSFIQNGVSHDSQFYVEYSGLLPSIDLLYNYWDDWVTPDADLDGIVDIPYHGMTYYGLDPLLNDSFPVTWPHPISIPDHFVIPALFIHPNSSASILSGTVIVDWRLGFDSQYHLVYYDLYISSDGGVTWLLVAMNLTDQSYSLDTTAYPNGNNYLLRLVTHDWYGFQAESISNYFSIDNVASHSLTDPVIFYPSVGDVVNGTVTVQWNASIDSLGHLVLYDLYYSDDNGFNWYIIASGLGTTSFDWDTTGLMDGNVYMLMVNAYDGTGLNALYVMPGTFTINNTQSGGSVTPHTLSQPYFIYPSGGETLSGVVTIEWNSSIDSLGHLVYYSLYYSNDDGNTWASLTIDTTSTSFSWDTTQVADGPTYVLRLIATDYAGLQVETWSGVFGINNSASSTTTTPTTPPTSTTTIITTTPPDTTTTTTTNITTSTTTTSSSSPNTSGSSTNGTTTSDSNNATTVNAPTVVTPSFSLPLVILSMLVFTLTTVIIRKKRVG